MFGYHNNLLRVNLATGKISHEQLNEEWLDLYVGGKGLGLRYLLDEVPPRTDPLSAQNKLILMTGPLQGTTVSTTAKLVLIAKSPLTGTLSDSYIGGACSYALKRAGYDGIIVEGAATTPVYLYLHEDDVQIREAKDLWGQDARDVERTLKNRHGTKGVVLAIGKAGENLIPIACVTSESTRQAGRGGIGAVFGSKKLKAIYLEGTKKTPLADETLFYQRIREIHRESADSPDNEWVRSDGTPIIVGLAQDAGLLPVCNFQQGTAASYAQVDTEAIKKLRVGRRACLGCRLGCRGVMQFEDGAVREAPEYETIALCGSNCGIFDLRAITEFNELCDGLGIDTMSLGGTLAFAMEMTERGIHDFGIRFGEVEKYLKVPALVAELRDIGAELSRGVKYLSQKYGGQEFAMHVKGQEFPGYDPRGSWTMSLAYGTADRGADHNRGWPVGKEAFDTLYPPLTFEGKAKLMKELQDASTYKYSMIFCDFWAASPEIQAEVLNLVTGRNDSVADLENLGDRIWNMARIFNLAEGFRRKDDLMPQRIHRDALQDGPPAGVFLPEDAYLEALDEYYQLRGWDSDGVPTLSTLEQLKVDRKAIELFLRVTT